MRTTWWVLLIPGLAMGQVTKTTVQVPMPNCAANPAFVNYPADVYRPAGAGPFGLVGLAHGFQNSKDNGEVLARQLAAKNLVVVVPQFPLLLFLQCGASDHARNAEILIAAMDQQITVGGIDAQKLGVAGHSAGGLSAFLAASQRTMAAVVLLDAVDNMGLGAAQVANVLEPTLLLSAEPSMCNTQNNSAAWFAGLGGLKAKLKVVNGTHCEPQDPLNAVCTGGCGGTTNAARQALFKKYTVGFFDRFLNGVTAPCLETIAAADALAGTIALVDFQLGGCGDPIDAGVADAGASPDAGSVDAGVPDAGIVDAGVVDAGVSDAGLADAGDVDAGMMMVDAGSGAVDAGATSDAGMMTEAPVVPTGCGCSSGGIFAIAAAIILVARRRQRFS